MGRIVQLLKASLLILSDIDKIEEMVNINLKYKIEDRDLKITLEVIENFGFKSAMDLAYNKAMSILKKDEESILPVMLLAWSQNLLSDARNPENKLYLEDLYQLSSFYRRLAQKVYQYQRNKNSIGKLPGFLHLM